MLPEVSPSSLQRYARRPQLCQCAELGGSVGSRLPRCGRVAILLAPVGSGSERCVRGAAAPADFAVNTSGRQPCLAICPQLGNGCSSAGPPRGWCRRWQQAVCADRGRSGGGSGCRRPRRLVRPIDLGTGLDRHIFCPCHSIRGARAGIALPPAAAPAPHGAACS